MSGLPMAKQRAETTPPCKSDLISPPMEKKSKTIRRSEAGMRARKERDRLRVKTRINISHSFTRWRKFKEDMDLRSDGDVARFLLNFYEQKSSKLLISPGPSMQEPKARSSRGHVSASEIGKLLQKNDAEHQSGTTQTSSETYCIQDRFEEMEVIIDEDEYYSVENRLSDSDSDMGNAIEAAELSAAGADDSGDEDVHVPIFPQRSHLDSDVENAEETPEDIYVPVFHQRTKASELLLECEEEELQPWQKQTSHVHLKVEVDDGELSNDQTDIKPDPSLLQMNAKSSSTQTVKTETPPTVYNNQGVIVVAPHLSSNTEFIDSLGTQCSAGK